MALVRVHAAVGEQAHQVQRRATALGGRAGREKPCVLEEGAVAQSQVDAEQVLRHHAAGAEGQVSDLGVAHHSGRKPHGFARRLEQRPRVLRQPAVEDGRARERDGVARRGRRVAPAVADQEEDRRRFLQARGAGRAGAGERGGAAVRTRKAALEIRQHVHEGDVGLVGGLVGREVRVDLVVGGGLGRHVVEVIGRRETPEVAIAAPATPRPGRAPRARTAASARPAAGRCPARRRGPGPRRPTRSSGAPRAGRGGEAARWPRTASGTRAPRCARCLLDPGLEELEDPGLLPLVLAERLEVHEERDDLALGARDPAVVLLGGQRPFGPGPVGEAERDVVREAEIAQEERQAARRRGAVDVARRAGARQRLDSVGEDAAEALLLEKAGQRVGIDELGVAEDRRLPAERLGDGRPVQLDLLGELLPRGEPRERVVRGLGQELDAASGRAAARRRNASSVSGDQSRAARAGSPRSRTRRRSAGGAASSRASIAVAGR